jgi:hypothetical protein
VNSSWFGEELLDDLMLEEGSVESIQVRGRLAPVGCTAVDRSGGGGSGGFMVASDSARGGKYRSTARQRR